MNKRQESTTEAPYTETAYERELSTSSNIQNALEALLKLYSFPIHFIEINNETRPSYQCSKTKQVITPKEYFNHGPTPWAFVDEFIATLDGVTMNAKSQFGSIEVFITYRVKPYFKDNTWFGIYSLSASPIGTLSPVSVVQMEKDHEH